jgi:hypothetical protein
VNYTYKLRASAWLVEETVWTVFVEMINKDKALLICDEKN